MASRKMKSTFESLVLIAIVAVVFAVNQSHAGEDLVHQAIKVISSVVVSDLNQQPVDVLEEIIPHFEAITVILANYDLGRYFGMLTEMCRSVRAVKRKTKPNSGSSMREEPEPTKKAKSANAQMARLVSKIKKQSTRENTTSQIPEKANLLTEGQLYKYRVNNKREAEVERKDGIVSMRIIETVGKGIRIKFNVNESENKIDNLKEYLNNLLN